MTTTVSPVPGRTVSVSRLPVVLLMLALGVGALGTDNASASNTASAQLDEIDGVYIGLVSLGIAQPDFAVLDSHVEIVISSGSTVGMLLQVTLEAGLRYVDDALVCTATIESTYRGSGSVAAAEIETVLPLEDYQILSSDGQMCGITESYWSTTIEQDLAADFADDESFLFTGVVTDGVITGSAAEGLYVVSASKDPLATPTEGTGSDASGSGATTGDEPAGDATTTNDAEEGFLPGSSDEDGGGLPPAVIVGLVLAGGGAAAAGLVRTGTINLGPRGPGPEEAAGYGGTPGSAQVIVDMLERTAVRRSQIVKTWRTEGIDGLDRLARQKEAEGVATKNPIMAAEARQALSIMRNTEFAGMAQPPPAGDVPPPPPPPPSP